MNRHLLIICFLIFTIPCFSQVSTVVDTTEPTIAELKADVDKLFLKLEKKSILQIGFSVGPRTMAIKSYEKRGFKNLSISAIDSTLKLDRRDKSDFVISAIISITPGKNLRLDNHENLTSFLRRISFIANINIADISGASVEEISSVHNKSIEGGIGVGFNLSSNFSIGITFERLFNRRLKDYILDLKDQQIIINNEILTELNPENDALFQNDNIHARTFKFIYYLNR